MSSYKKNCDLVLGELAKSLSSVQEQQIDRLVDSILSADRVFFVGVGRVLLSLQAFCKRLAHLGIKCCYVGDITEPAITKDDLLIVGSGSGESIFPLGIARKAYSVGAHIIHIGSNPKSSMSEYAEYMVRIPVRTKLHLDDEICSVQPMTSLFEQALLLLGDIVSLEIIQRQGLDMDKLWRYHANLE